MRGHTENNGNLYQLLILWSNEDKELKQWITDSKYMSHEIITEQIILLGQRLLRSLLQQIQQRSPAWYALMKPLMYVANKEEQLNASIRWVDDAYNIRKILLDCTTCLQLLPMLSIHALKISLFTV